MSHQHETNINLNSADLKPLFKTRAFRHALAMLFDWIVIFAAITVSTVYFHYNGLVYFLAVIIIGARMHALAILMHDATHYRFLKNRKWNDLLTNLLTMYPLFTSIETYRKNHMAHHRHLNTEQDPDWVSKLGKRAFRFPKTRVEFLLTILSYLSFYQGISDAIWFFQRFGYKKKRTDSGSKISVTCLLFFALLFTVLTVGGLWVSFILYWLVPYFSTFFMFQYIRSVSEHYGELAYDHLLTSTRSVKTNRLERFFLAPHHVGYHLEHHLYPGVPFYNLPRLHEELMKDEHYQRKAHITHGYLTGLLNELGNPDLVMDKAH